jgi:hypothetical protein
MKVLQPKKEAERFVYASSEYEELDSSVERLEDLLTWFDQYHTRKRDLKPTEQHDIRELLVLLKKFKIVNDQVGQVSYHGGKSKRELGISST